MVLAQYQEERKMRLLSKEQDYVDILDSIRNQSEAMVMDIFNAGYSACIRDYTEFYNQANAAIEQGLINEVPAGQNPFIVLLQKANKMKDTSKE